MRDNKGFTLVELLAVIVILAVIALIATPQVLSMIESSRKGAAESSMLSYVDGVEKAIVTNLMNNTFGVNYDQTYNITSLTLTATEDSRTKACRTEVKETGDAIAFKYTYSDATGGTCSSPAVANPGVTTSNIEFNVDVKGDQPADNVSNIMVVSGNVVLHAQLKFGKYYVSYFYDKTSGTTTYCSSDAKFITSQTDCAAAHS